MSSDHGQRNVGVIRVTLKDEKSLYFLHLASISVTATQDRCLLNSKNTGDALIGIRKNDSDELHTVSLEKHFALLSVIDSQSLTDVCQNI